MAVAVSVFVGFLFLVLVDSVATFIVSVVSGVVVVVFVDIIVGAVL